MGRGTAGRSPVVEGSTHLAASRRDRFRGSGRIGQNVASWNPHDLDPLRGQPFRPPFIAFRTLAHVVGDPVDLEAEFRRGAIEVDHEPADRVLALDLDAPSLSAQLAP